MGNALKALGRPDDAAACYRRALEITADLPEALYNLGIVLEELGQHEDAIAGYRHALKIKPDYAEARLNLGLLLLLNKQYIEGWPEYEVRYHPSIFKEYAKITDVSFPQWQGEPLTGKSLMIMPERGFGDEIQFARYFPLLRKRGVASITIVCHSPLVPLFEKMDSVDTVVTRSAIPSLPSHDYWTFAMSLPLHFATTIETIPNALPYLSAPPERLSKWRDRFPTGGLKVGLVWKGSPAHNNDTHRSLPGLSVLEPLWSVPGVTFVSLQKGQGEEEAAAPPARQPILDLGPDIQDFADTAAIVAELDLVICIDTSIAHLAGALNKPCWILLPAIGVDWRWLRNRMDSPWYPDVVRLFRQTQAQDWATPVGEVAQALQTWVDERTQHHSAGKM